MLILVTDVHLPQGFQKRLINTGHLVRASSLTGSANARSVLRMSDGESMYVVESLSEIQELARVQAQPVNGPARCPSGESGPGHSLG